MGFYFMAGMVGVMLVVVGIPVLIADWPDFGFAAVTLAIGAAGCIVCVCGMLSDPAAAEAFFAGSTTGSSSDGGVMFLPDINGNIHPFFF